MSENCNGTFTEFDQQMMQRALTLARASIGLASPNPRVGCVIAQGEQIIGEGAHRYADKDHAEIVALKQAGAAARGATAYVTLEPCSHRGRTGPCAHAMVDAGIARVVVATLDPNPTVSGKGMLILKHAHVEAECGLLEKESRALNDAFAHSILTHQPLVTLKAALSVDGKLAPLPVQRKPGQPFWLTGTASLEEVHRLRHANDAILTGVGTILADDAMLTDRSSLPRRRPLMRIVLDTHLRTPLTARIVDTAKDDLIFFCSPKAPTDKQHLMRQLGVRVEPVAETADGKLDLVAILKFLDTLDIRSILLEGGSGLNGAFLAANLVDRVILFFSEMELGNDALPFAAGGYSPFALIEKLSNVERCDFDNPTGTHDACIRGTLKDPWADVFTLTPPLPTR